MFVKALDIIIRGEPEKSTQNDLSGDMLRRIIAQTFYFFKCFNKLMGDENKKSASRCGMPFQKLVEVALPNSLLGRGVEDVDGIHVKRHLDLLTDAQF